MKSEKTDELNREKVVYKRNSNYELLRIVAMCGVIILHYCGYGGAVEYAQNEFWNLRFLRFMQSICSCCVDLFLMISGYFLCTTDKRSLKKIILLFIQVILFNMSFYLGSAFFGINKFDTREFLIFCVPDNYFVVMYSALYILSPYINIILNNLNKEQLKRFVFSYFIIFSMWDCFVDLTGSVFRIEWRGLSTISVQGSQNGFNIVNFVTIYLIASYIRKTRLKVECKKLVWGIAALVFAIYAWSSIEYKMEWTSISKSYDNPLVILLATAVFLLLSNISFSSKLINELARASFTCFLFHQPFMAYIGVKKAVQNNFGTMSAHLMISVIMLYFVSYAVYKIYDYGMKIVSRVIKVAQQN